MKSNRVNTIQRISMDDTRPSIEGQSRKVVVALAFKDTKSNCNHRPTKSVENAKC